MYLEMQLMPYLLLLQAVEAGQEAVNLTKPLADKLEHPAEHHTEQHTHRAAAEMAAQHQLTLDGVVLEPVGYQTVKTAVLTVVSHMRPETVQPVVIYLCAAGALVALAAEAVVVATVVAVVVDTLVAVAAVAVAAVTMEVVINLILLLQRVMMVK
jgi:hypothetical protein